MVWQRSLAALFAPLLLAAACSLVLDTDRTFADASEDGADSGGGGSSGALGAGNDGKVECTTGSRECVFAVRRECIDGRWEARACPDHLPACVDGHCRVCVPGTFQCANVTQLEKCSPLGEWEPDAPCEVTKWCVDDACVHNEPPELYIEAPINNAVFIVESPVRFASVTLEGRAFDENGAENLSGQIEWHATQVGGTGAAQWLGRGASVEVSLENVRGCLVPGTGYDISATVVDRAGYPQQQSIRVWVQNRTVCTDT